MPHENVKTAAKMKTYYSKPSRTARTAKREAARKKILDEGIATAQGFDAVVEEIATIRAEITAGHAKSTWSAEAQQAAESRLSAARARRNVLVERMAAADALTKKLADYACT